MAALIDILRMLLNVAQMFVFAHFIISWLLAFSVLNIHQPVVRQIWEALSRLLEPIYAPIRRVLPDLGGVDLSPLVALLGIWAMDRILIEILFSL